MIASLFPEAIDNSMRKELIKCEMAAHYKYEMGIRANDEQRVDLVAGGAFAAGMERMRLAYYEDGKSAYDALQLGIQACYQKYGDFTPPPKSNKTADRMAGALAFYAQECPLETDAFKPIRFADGTYAIEVGFNHELPIQHPTTGKPLTYCGRFDMLARDTRDNSIWVVDEKTTSQMGEKWANQWPLDSQMTGYCWGANKLLEGIGETVSGALINGIAIRLRDYEHGQFQARRSDWEIERWYKQMLRDVTQWRLAFLHGDHNQALDHACAYYNNPCEYAPLCMSRNPERIIETSFVVKRWNPLTREET